MRLFESINLSGKVGSGVPPDMVCEWSVKSVKGLQKRFATNYDPALAQRSLRANNPINDMKENLLGAMMIDTSKDIGGHSAKLIKEDDIDEIRLFFNIKPKPGVYSLYQEKKVNNRAQFKVLKM